MKYIKYIILILILGLTIPGAAVIQNRAVNALKNGDFRAGLSGWSVTGTAEVRAGSTAHQNYNIAHLVNSNYPSGAHLKDLACPFVGGKWYEVTGRIRADGAGTTAKIIVGHAASAESYAVNTTSGNWQAFSVIIKAKSDGYYYDFGVYGSGIEGWSEVCNLTSTPYYGSIQNRAVNLLKDGDMEQAGITSWAQANGATLTKRPSTSPPGLRVLEVSREATWGAAAQTILVSGKTYKLQGKARSIDGTAIPHVGHNLASNAYWVGTTSLLWQDINITFTAGDAATLYLAKSSAGERVEFDNVSFTLHHGSTQNRDVNLLRDGDMEQAGITNWTSINGAVATKEAGALNTTGSRVIKVANSTVSSGNIRNAWNNVLSGEVYRITGQVKSIASNMSGTVYRIGGVSQSLFVGPVGPKTTSFDITKTMLANGYIAFYTVETGGTTTGEVWWDNLSITRQ